MTIIPAGERGVLRIFAVDLPDDRAHDFVAVDPTTSTPSRFNAALAPDTLLDPDFIEAFPVGQLTQFGHDDLFGYLNNAAYKSTDLAHNKAALRSARGWVVLVWSDAFRGAQTPLHLAPPIRLMVSLRAAAPEAATRPAHRAMPLPKPRRNLRPSNPTHVRNAVTAMGLVGVVLAALYLVYVGLPF